MVGPTQGAEGFGLGRGGGTYRRRLERDLGMVLGPFHRDIHSDDGLHRRRRDRSVRGGRAATRLLPTPSRARLGLTVVVLALDQVSKEYAGKPVTFIGVDSSDVRDSAGKLLADLKVTYPTVYDKAGINGGIATAWSVASLPQTWFIAKDGSRSGRIPRPLSAAELRNRIDQLLTAAA